MGVVVRVLLRLYDNFGGRKSDLVLNIVFRARFIRSMGPCRSFLRFNLGIWVLLERVFVGMLE